MLATGISELSCKEAKARTVLPQRWENTWTFSSCRRKSKPDTDTGGYLLAHTLRLPISKGQGTAQVHMHPTPLTFSTFFFLPYQTTATAIPNHIPLTAFASAELTWISIDPSLGPLIRGSLQFHSFPTQQPICHQRDRARHPLLPPSLDTATSPSTEETLLTNPWASIVRIGAGHLTVLVHNTADLNVNDPLPQYVSLFCSSTGICSL